MKGIGKEFIEKTYYKYAEPSDQTKGLPQPPLELDFDSTKQVFDLPAPNKIQFGDLNLRKAIENRKSIRQYSEQPLSLAELSWLLWCAQGVKEIKEVGNQEDMRQVTLRTVPSAGARHAFEIYLLVNRVEGLRSGLYRFLAIDHKIVECNLAEDIADSIKNAALRQVMVKKSAVTVIWTAVAYRMKWRYGERGYRYMFIDAGHACQNLYLAAETINCGVCAIAAFDDEEFNKLLEIDGIEQFVIYLAPVGKK